VVTLLLEHTDLKIEAVCILLIDDCGNSLGMTAESLNIGKDTIHMILEQNLGQRNMCPRFFPPALITEHKQDWIASCQHLLSTMED
jgi:hypothetical protein